MMKRRQINAAKFGVILVLMSAVAGAKTVAEKPVYGEYKDWRVLGVSHRLDREFVRSILGNDVAIAAARSGKVQPWPDGTVIAKLSWKEQTHIRWPEAIVPGEFAGAEAMVKDSKKYAATGGWGFGRWEGERLVMNDADKTATCLTCHSVEKDHDYVFTAPVLQ